jgi:putative chitinase
MNAFKAVLDFLAKLFAKLPQPAPPVAIEPPPNIEKPPGLSAKIIAAATGATLARAIEYLPHLEAAMAEFEINTPQRQAMFLAQIGHESGGLKWTTEIWGPTPAQLRYEGRKDLGNTRPGDGYKFRGRGLLQTTGRDNYRATGQVLGVDLWAMPELLSQPALATRSAAWFWSAKGLNEIADRGDNIAATKRINGGTNGLADRQALYAAAMQAFA